MRVQNLGSAFCIGSLCGVWLSLFQLSNQFLSVKLQSPTKTFALQIIKFALSSVLIRLLAWYGLQYNLSKSYCYCGIILVTGCLTVHSCVTSAGQKHKLYRER